jgi:hypothetical protein
VHGAERQHDRVLEGGGLQLEVEAPAETFSQRESPRAVQARAERRMDDEMIVAGLVEEALEHERVGRRQHGQSGLRGRQVLDELLRRPARQPELVRQCRGRGDSAELLEQLVHPPAQP